MQIIADGFADTAKLFRWLVDEPLGKMVFQLPASERFDGQVFQIFQFIAKLVLVGKQLKCPLQRHRLLQFGQQFEGVGDVQAYSSTYALRVWMKPDVMAQYGLEPDDVNDAINRQSFVAAVGALGEQSKNAFQYTIKYKGRYADVKQFEDIVLKNDKDGNLLRLKDVAKVELGATAYNFKGIIDSFTYLC